MPRVSFGADLAFERNSSALVGVSRDGDKYRVIVLKEIIPRDGAPLKPKFVIDTFAGIILGHHAASMVSDAHYRASAKEHLEPHGIRFIDAPTGREGVNAVYLLLKKLVTEKRLILPNHRRLLAQVKGLVAKPQPGGSFKIGSPQPTSALDRSHGDIASALVLALWRAERTQEGGGGGVVGPSPSFDARPIGDFPC